MNNPQSSKSYRIDERFIKTQGTEIYTGVELIIKGLLETDGGSHLWTGYPGSPVAGFFDLIKKLSPLLEEKGIRGAQANNEALGAAMLNGSQMSGLRGIVSMKSVGVHVASDALSLGNMIGSHPEGGALVLVGDDPWNESTQVPADSRFICKHMHMPILEPSSPQELKDWINLAFQLSSQSSFYISYLVTTYQADGAGTVTTYPNQYPSTNMHERITLKTSKVDQKSKIGLPPYTGLMETRFAKRREKLWEVTRSMELDTILYTRKAKQEKAPLGFVTSGYAHIYLEQALYELGLSGAYPILKLGITYPIDPQIVLHFTQTVENIVVLEEKRSFIEDQILSLLNNSWNKEPSKYKKDIPIYGKAFPNELPGFTETLGFTPAHVLEQTAAIIKLLGDKKNPEKMSKELHLIQSVRQYNLPTPIRFPTFCPGCPHRDSASVLKDIKKDFLDPVYMKFKHKRSPIDLVFHGDTGCYSMLAYEPYEGLMHNYSGMGLGGGTGAGIDPFINNKQVTFMGDGTFFHSGEIAISNAIKNNQDITFIILDNKTTAMTGHQPTPGIEDTIDNQKSPLQKIQEISTAIGKQTKTPVIAINPENRDLYRKTVENTIMKNGVKILIAQKECGIVSNRRNKIKEYKIKQEKGYTPQKNHMNITEEVCEHCLECTNSTGCPGLTFKETNYGPKIQIDFSWCVNDGACMKTEVCPSFERVTVKRKASTSDPLDFINNYSMRDPQTKITIEDQWCAHLSGIGGTGIGVLSGIIARSSAHEGYQVRYGDKKGLAIRCGSVFSNILVYKEGSERSCVIPYGKADLLIGLDFLEAVRSVNPTNGRGVVHKNKTICVVNMENLPNVANLLNKERIHKQSLLQEFKKYIKEQQSFFVDLEEIALKYFSSKIYNNLILLGIAYQEGHIPLKEESLIWGIKTVMGRSLATENVLAFKLGRYISLNAEQFINPIADASYQERCSYFLDMATRNFSTKKQVGFKNLISQYESLPNLTEVLKKDLIRRIYDLICHSGQSYAKLYLDLVQETYQKEADNKELLATRAVIWNLSKVMLIKDEVYVSHLLTSEEKYKRDKRKYDIDPDRGDRITYVHYNKPHFNVGPFHIQFRIHTRDWQLKLMKQAGFLRKLLPSWHAREKLFRDWYISLVKEFNHDNHAEYTSWVSILNAPVEVTGYREIRYPKEDKVKQKVYDIILKINKNKAPQKEPINMWNLFQKEKMTTSL